MNKFLYSMRQYMAEENGSGTSAAPAAAPETNEGADVDWEAMNDGAEQGVDDGGGDDDVVVDEPAADDTTAHPVEPPKPDDTTVDPKPADPVTPIPDPAVVETPEQQAAAQKDLQDRFDKWRQSETERLTKDYAFDEDTAARLQTEPELVLPELAAKMHMQVMQQVVETVQRLMPSMLQPELKRGDMEAKATTMFSEINPDLDLSKHRSAVIEAGKAFRQMNPKATPEQAAKGIGDIVRISLGLAVPPPKPTAGKNTHRPPVAGGRGVAPATGKVKKTDWDELLDD